jgi:hypothetical protein
MDFTWFNPMKWARDITFAILLALDFKHTYEFVNHMQTAAQTREPVVLFGPIFTSLGIPLTNGIFDSLSYAFIVTATIFFMSNTLAKRLAHNHRSWSYWMAMIVGVGLSALTNAGTMFLGATGTSLIPLTLLGLTAAILGGVVTGGLFMFASMDAWDMKARVQKAADTRKRNRAHADMAEMEKLRRQKYTPAKYRQA